MYCCCLLALLGGLVRGLGLDDDLRKKMMYLPKLVLDWIMFLKFDRIRAAISLGDKKFLAPF